MMKAQLNRNDIPKRSMAFFRPNFSATKPAGKAVTRAPSGNMDPTVPPWLSVSWRESEELVAVPLVGISWGRTGDVQAKTVPAHTAPKETENVLEYVGTTLA